MKKKTFHRNLKSSGFTIIELMISMTILSFIALGIYQSSTQSFSIRDNLERDTDFYNSIRVVLDVMTRDITHMYSPMSNALPGDLGKSNAPQAQNGTNTYMPQQPTPPKTESKYNLTVEPTASNDFWGDTINSQGVRPSRIQGDTNKLSFVSISHMRLFEDTRESELTKITYQLEDDTEPSLDTHGNRRSTKVLIKLEDPDVFSDKPNSETEVRYTLLNNIKSMEFKYLDGEKDRWEIRWDNVTMADFKGNFPFLIEVTLEVYVPKTDNTFKVIQRFRPELPL